MQSGLKPKIYTEPYTHWAIYTEENAQAIRPSLHFTSRQTSDRGLASSPLQPGLKGLRRVSMIHPVRVILLLLLARGGPPAGRPLAPAAPL